MKINETVRQMNPPRYTTKMASELVGRSTDTLVRWRRTGLYKPSAVESFGSLDVPLYTSEDIKKMKRLKKTIKPGRKASV